MPDYTDNHGYHLYEQDEDPWTHRPDFEQLETEVPIRDIEANLSNHTPHAGAQFRATDTGALYSGNGTEWELDDFVGASVNGRVLGSVVNAGWFDTYDEARQFTVDNGYGTIYVPAGEYTEKCVVPDGIQVYGDGYATHFNSPGNGAGVGQDGILRRLRISSGTGSIHDAIDPVGDGATVANVTIGNAQRNGILVRSSSRTYITGVRFESTPTNNGIQYLSASQYNILNHSWIRGGIANPSPDNFIGDGVFQL